MKGGKEEWVGMRIRRIYVEEGMGWRKGHDERVGEKERGSEIGRERRE